MFELRSIRASAKFKSVKEPELEIPAVELVAELVGEELKGFGFYAMVCVEYASLGIVGGDVRPWEDFPDKSFAVLTSFRAAIDKV